MNSLKGGGGGEHREVDVGDSLAIQDQASKSHQ